jgi:hypothetical protein
MVQSHNYHVTSSLRKDNSKSGDNLPDASAAAGSHPLIKN